MQRSLSITIIAVIQGLISSLSLVSGIFLILLATGAVQVYSQDLTNLSLSLKGLVALGLALSLFGIVVTVGLWQLKPWGWIGSLMFQALCILNNCLAIWLGQSLTQGVYFSWAICIALMTALLMPGVRDRFGDEISESNS